MVKAVLTAAVWAVALSATAQLVTSQEAEARQLLEAGNARAALAIYDALLAEEPGSVRLQYNRGQAHYQLAMGAAEADQPDEARAALERAARDFEAATMARDEGLQRSARYNLANSRAQMARLAAEPIARPGNAGQFTVDPQAASERMGQAIAAHRESVEEYRDLEARYPDHDGIAHNLDHMRYALKELLRKQRQQQEQQQQQGQDGEQQEQEQDDGQDGEGEQQPGEEPQPQEPQPGEEEPPPGQEQEPRPQEGEQEQEEEEERRDQQPQPVDEDQPPEDQEQPAAAPEQAEEPPGSETLEALLDSLEDIDREQQQRMRQQPLQIPRDPEWW